MKPEQEKTSRPTSRPKTSPPLQRLALTVLTAIFHDRIEIMKLQRALEEDQ
jgi:hypothetical protein